MALSNFKSKLTRMEPEMIRALCGRRGSRGDDVRPHRYLMRDPLRTLNKRANYLYCGINFAEVWRLNSQGEVREEWKL